MNTSYNGFEGCDDHAERQSSPDNYYHEDHSYAEYYDDGEERAVSETYYNEDTLVNEFKRLDLEPEGHSADKDTFFHHDLNQYLHVNCQICDGYIEEFYNHHAHLNEFHDYNDETNAYYN